jgi:PAS fold
MSLRSWVSRLSFWLAAFCAVLSFVVEAPLGPRLGSFAIICAVFSLLVWRGWKPPARDWQPTEPSMLEPEGLIEAGKRITRSCAQSHDLDEALRAVAQVLTQELGALEVRPGRILLQPQGRSFMPLTDPSLPKPRGASGKLKPAGERALREGANFTDAALGHALVVKHAGDLVALIQFDALVVQVPAEAMAQLLALAGTELGRVVARDLRPSAGAALEPAAPLLASSAEGSEFLAAISADRELALFILEPDHRRLVAISRRAERDFAARRQRVLGKTVAEVFSGVTAEQTQRAIEEALAGGVSVEQSLVWSTSRGQRGANVSWCALRHADGTLRWLVAMARDLQAEPSSRAERRAMPRHGRLHADAARPPVTALPRPTAVVSRQGGTS